MPIPPPPPPPLPPAAAKIQQTLPKVSGSRAMLLNEIQKGTQLKKAVTNDRSAPVIGGQVTGQ